MDRKVLALLLALIWAVSVLAACEASTTSGDLPNGPDPTRGEEIYNTGGSSGLPCTSCHTLDGTDLVGPSLQGVASRAPERDPNLAAEEYLRDSIIQPSNYVTEGFPDVMAKNYGSTLSSQEIDDLVAFLLTLK